MFEPDTFIARHQPIHNLQTHSPPILGHLHFALLQQLRISHHFYNLSLILHKTVFFLRSHIIHLPTLRNVARRVDQSGFWDIFLVFISWTVVHGLLGLFGCMEFTVEIDYFCIFLSAQFLGIFKRGFFEFIFNVWICSRL